MSEKEKNARNLSDAAYTKKLHSIGTTTMLAMAVITFFPTIYICAFKGGFPGWGVMAGAAAMAAGKEVFSWFFEPIMYFPMVGIAGLYICCTAGNSTSVRIPAAMSAQNAIDAKPGTRKAEVSSVFAMVASVIVSLSALVVVILFGDYLLRILPEAVRAAFDYAIPAVYGAVVVVVTSVLTQRRKS